MAITTNIKNYPATHGKNEGGGGGTTIIMGGGNADIPADLNVTSISADRGDISLLKGKSLTFNDGQFIYIGSNEGTVNKIRGNELKYKLGAISELHSDSIETKTLEADDLNAVNAWIDTLNSKSITTEYLTVTKQAHFFELVIDKIKSIGGQMIMTAANCVVDYVKAVDANGNYLANLDDESAKAYDIFWLSSDASGRAVTNDWQVNDQAICQSFNNVSTGVNYDVSNKYYWRLVTEKLTDRYMNLSTGAELPLEQSQQATVNSVTITAPYLADENDTRLDTGWNTQAQEITGVITGATWTETSGGAGQQTIGTMTTTNTVFGIQITPVKGEATETVYTNYFGFSCTPSRLNVGIYYTDKTSQYFTAPEQLQSSYRYETLTQAPIEAIVITNAEEVEWKLVHGIRLSNTDCDEMLDGYTSIPSAGDNVIQLGYRYTEYEQSQPEYDIPRSSAIIIAAYHTPDSGLTPPSYAQYTKITDYNLASHRQTYIDANGSRFVGDFYVDANTSIQDLIDESTHTQYYLHIAYANSSDGQTDFTKNPVSGVSYSYMGYCSNSTASDESLTYTDYQWVLVPGVAGANGGHWAYAYKNWTEQPVEPAAGTTIEQLTDGWYTTPTTPDFENGYATYMSQCFVSGDTGQYGIWTTPIRITGENGKAGEDGTEIEFIYKHFKNEQTFSNNNNNPANWQTNQNDGYVGPTGFEWSDNPTGVSDTYKYEYVSLRYKTFGQWGAFTVPVIWAKWGEKGQDGDGYEYIYKVFTSEQPFSDYKDDDNRNPANWEASQTEDYLGPLLYQWSDEPQSVTATNKFQYCAVRKKTNGTWGKFSTPTIWGTYGIGEQGPQGDQGEQGEPGESTQVYRLIDNGSHAYVRMSLDESNDVAEELVISLNYKVAKFVGGTVTFMTYDELLNFPKEYGDANGLYAYVRHTKNKMPTENNYLWYRLALNEDGTLTYSYTSTDSLIVNNNPTIEVRLIPYNVESMTTASEGLNYTKDSLFVPITLLPNAAFNVVQGDHASIATLVVGQEGNKQAISTLKQDMESITTKVTTIEGNYVDESKLTQTATEIKSTVLETVRKEIDYKVEKIVDLTDLDVNKFYPISIRLCANGDDNSPRSQSNDRVRIVIDRTLDYDTFGNIKSDTNMTPNAYGTNNGNNGFDAVLDYTTQASGWGATWTSSGGSTTWGDNELNGQGYDTYRFINNYLVHWTVNQSYTANSKTITIPRNAIFGSIRQNYMDSTEIVYARGGSKYRVRTDWRYAKIDKHPTGYDWSSGNYRRTAPVITWTDDSSLIIPEKDQMQKSEIIQTANNIQLNVYDQLKEKTGIDVSSGQITLDADNTIINGSLKIKNANEGVIIYNDEGQAAVEVVKDTIGTFGTSQNVTSYYKSSAFTYSCITGTNSFRQYIDPVDTSQGYSSELKYSENKENLSARVSFGNLKSGVKIKWNAKNFGAYIRAFGGDYNNKTGQYAYKVEGLNTSNYTLSQPLQVRIRLRNVYADTWYTIKDWANLTSVSSSSLDAWTSIPHSSGTYYWLNGVNIEHTINSDGYYELFFDYRMSNPIISGTSKFKLFYFDTYLSITNEISINTKIGTDGIRTITPNTELWAGADQISNIYQNSDKTGIYGSGIDSFGYTVTKYGPSQAFGTQLSDLTAYDSVRQLIHVSGDYSGNNRATGKVHYNTDPFIGNVQRNVFCYNYVSNGIMPGIVVFDGVGGKYSNVDPYFTFIFDLDKDTLPTGLTVIIINHSGRKLHVAANSKLPQKMYNRDTTNLSTEIVIENGRSATFVHLGDNYYKLIYCS